MNYLAHLLLAGEDPQWQLGGLLGDHVRGHAWQHYAPPVAAGILLHRAIDHATDTHPAVMAARRRLPNPYRRFGGIILDVFFDHLLAQRWSEFHPQPLPDFAASVYQLLHRQREQLPASLVRLGDYLEHHNLLVNYADADYLALVFGGLSQRLSKVNPLADAVQLLQHNADSLNHELIRLMDDLTELAAAQRGPLLQRTKALAG